VSAPSCWLLEKADLRLFSSLGLPLTLPPESEEVAGFFGAMLETDHARDATFRENFFRDFKKVLDDHPPVSPSFMAVGVC